MTRRGDEIKAGVDPRVVVVVEGALDFELLLQITLKLFIDVVHHRLIAKIKENSQVNKCKTFSSRFLGERTEILRTTTELSTRRPSLSRSHVPLSHLSSLFI